MSAQHDTAAATQESTPTASPAAQPSSPLREAPVTLPAPAVSALLTNPHLGGRGNGPVRQAAILQLQQAHGNRATGRLLQRQPIPAQESAVIQRQPKAPPVSPAQ